MYPQKGRRAWHLKFIESEQVPSWQVELEASCEGQPHPPPPPRKDLIKLKYGLEEVGQFLVEPRGSFGGVGLWKDIRKEAQQLKQKCKLMLGDGVILYFGKIGGVGRIRCVFLSQRCMLELLQKGL